jgi:heat shock protein HslJ
MSKTPNNNGTQMLNSAIENINKDRNLVEKYWKLIELNGSPVTPANNSKEAHIIFHTEDNRFSGDAGCNRFAGSYQIQDNARIVFSQTIATRMMCLDMDTETKFLQALEMADSYSVSGDTLTLSRAGMAPLVRFVVVYLR